jgi:hypothetical protein
MPIGLISSTYISINTTIPIAAIIKPDFNAELKSVFCVSIDYFFIVWFTAKIRKYE